MTPDLIKTKENDNDSSKKNRKFSKDILSNKKDNVHAIPKKVQITTSIKDKSTLSKKMPVIPNKTLAGRYSDLQPSERMLSSWRMSRASELSGVAQVIKPEKSGLETSIRRRKTHSSTLDKISEQGDVGLYLVRSNNVSAAQALSGFDVTFEKESRTRQVKRLKEFRSDTKAASNDEVSKWLSDQVSKRPTRTSTGIISSGITVPMTHEEAKKLKADLPNLSIMRNRALTVIPPTVLSTPSTSKLDVNAWHLEAIGMANARRDGKAYSGKGVTVALMDTGVDLTHPELSGKISACWRIKDNPSTTDFEALEMDSSHYDTDGHGTHVAGLICGNTLGVAPDARLVSLLMMPKRLSTLFDFVRCLDWAAGHPEISLVNLSAGISPFTSEMIPYVSDVISTGALPIFAIGNAGPNNSMSPGNYVDGASVGCVDAPGQKVSTFSGSGQIIWNQTAYGVPDLVAPGGHVWSSYPSGRYVPMSGTSMAAPVVAGVAACLIEQAKLQLSPLDLMDMLRRTCVKLVSETEIRQGAGLVQVPRKP